LARQDNASQKLKFGEWRPIGVCDDAPPGVQKAQMFTREDFLIITGPGVTRENWRENPQVIKIISRYSEKLARQSMKTSGMKDPTISKVNLVGAIMKLAVTPVLNKESKDGKLQLFQIQFEDKGIKKKKKTKKSWTLLLGILLVILLTLCIILGIAIYKKSQSRQYKTKRLQLPTFTTSFCGDPSDRTRYRRQLDEASRILQLKADDLLYQGRLSIETNCIEDFPQITFKEGLFLKCFTLVKRHGLLSQISSSDLKKVNACQREICRKKRSSGSAACSGN